MMDDQTEANLHPVSAQFRERRVRLHMNQAELAAEAGVNRDTVGAVEKGQGSNSSRRQIADALTRLEEQAGLSEKVEPAEAEAAEPAKAEPIRLTFHDIFGVGEIIAEGPGDKPDELVAAVVKLLAELRAKEGE